MLFLGYVIFIDQWCYFVMKESIRLMELCCGTILVLAMASAWLVFCMVTFKLLAH